MPACVLEMSSYDVQGIDGDLTDTELEDRYLPQNLFEMKENEPSTEEDWIVDDCKYSRKQKRSYSEYVEADFEFQQSKRQDIGSGSTVLRESYTKLSVADQATFKAIILEKTKTGPMDFGPYYVIEQVEVGKINIIQKDMWTRMRYIAAKFDNSVHLIDNWNKVYKEENRDAPNIDGVTSGTVSPISNSSCTTDDSEVHGVKKSTNSSLPRIRFASSDNVFYI